MKYLAKYNDGREKALYGYTTINKYLVSFSSFDDGEIIDYDFNGVDDVQPIYERQIQVVNPVWDSQKCIKKYGSIDAFKKAFSEHFKCEFKVNKNYPTIEAMIAFCGDCICKVGQNSNFEIIEDSAEYRQSLAEKDLPAYESKEKILFITCNHFGYKFAERVPSKIFKAANPEYHTTHEVNEWLDECDYFTEINPYSGGWYINKEAMASLKERYNVVVGR